MKTGLQTGPVLFCTISRTILESRPGRCRNKMERAQLVQGLKLFDATTIIVGSMIGSGIFIVSADMARSLRSPGLPLTSWVIAALMTIMAALSYGELAAAMPR